MTSPGGPPAGISASFRVLARMRIVGSPMAASRSVDEESGQDEAVSPDADRRLRFALLEAAGGPSMARGLVWSRWRRAGHAPRVDVHVHAKMRSGPRSTMSPPRSAVAWVGARTRPMAPDGDIHRRWKRLPGIDAGSRLRSRQAGRRLCGQINEPPRAPVGNGSCYKLRVYTFGEQSFIRTNYRKVYSVNSKFIASLILCYKFPRIWLE